MNSIFFSVALKVEFPNIKLNWFSAKKLFKKLFDAKADEITKNLRIQITCEFMIFIVENE